MCMLTPVSEAVGKRLQLLQGQLTRNVQHVAGLNPKALRFVPTKRSYLTLNDKTITF
jgi:CPSF A subunit region